MSDEPHSAQKIARHRAIVAKRSVAVDGRRTSVSLEDEFWEAFKEIAKSKGMRLDKLITRINNEREKDNLSSAIRLFVLRHYQAAAPTKVQ